MKNLKNILLAQLLFSALFFSCREPIDINVPDTEKKIVLNGLINPDSVISVNLSKSISILDKDDKIVFLENADVKIYENDVFKETLQYDTNGYYRGSIYPQIGKIYKVTAKYQNLDAVDAETNILNPPIISDINSDPQFQQETQTWYNSDTGEPFDTTLYTLDRLDVSITIDDPPADENYYFLTFTANLAQYQFYPPDYEPVFVGYKMTSIDYDILNMNWENHYYSRNMNGYVFSDNLFNGTNYTLNASVRTGNYAGNGYTEADNTLDKIYVNLHSVTKDFYDYVISFSKYQDIDGNPLAEPVNIKSNITGGFGFFSGYSTKKDSIMIVFPNN